MQGRGKRKEWVMDWMRMGQRTERWKGGGREMEMEVMGDAREGEMDWMGQ